MAENNKKFVKVDGAFSDPWKPTTIGDSIEGVYLGFQDVTAGKKGAFRSYHFRTKAGQKLSITGAGLKTVMSQVPPKSECRVTYRGTQETDRGEMKLWEVEVAAGTDLRDPFEDDAHE